MDGYLFLNVKKCSDENINLYGFLVKIWDYVNIYIYICFVIFLLF